ALDADRSAARALTDDGRADDGDRRVAPQADRGRCRPGRAARTMGVLTMATDVSRRRLTEEDVALAEQLGRRAAVAVENSRLHTKLTGIAETLQTGLLPAELPTIPGWEIASLYRPAATEFRVDVGGDFYEIFEQDGAWVVIMGDVTGKGVTAASVTALMRHGARVAGRTEPDPV